MEVQCSKQEGFLLYGPCLVGLCYLLHFEDPYGGSTQHTRGFFASQSLPCGSMLPSSLWGPIVFMEAQHSKQECPLLHSSYLVGLCYMEAQHSKQECPLLHSPCLVGLCYFLLLHCEDPYFRRGSTKQTRGLFTTQSLPFMSMVLYSLWGPLFLWRLNTVNKRVLYYTVPTLWVCFSLFSLLCRESFN